MIRDFVQWLKGVLFGSDDEDTSDSETEADFDEYTLYQIGNYICRLYDEGIPGFRNPEAVQWGEYSMDVVLGEKYRDVEEITPGMIDQLDRLLDDVGAYGTEFDRVQQNDDALLRTKVEDFRRSFFDQFTDEQINSVLIEIYHDAREDFQLESIVREMKVDGTVHEFRTVDPEPAQVRMESDPLLKDPMEFETKTVESEEVYANLDLVRNPIVSTIEDMVRTEAKMLWSEIETNSAVDLTHAGASGVMDSILESMLSIKEENFVPDLVVKDGNRIGISPKEYVDVPDCTVHGCDIRTDETSVMDVPFVVADSDRVGYRITHTPPVIQNTMGVEKYRRRLVWQGNYVVTNEDAVCGPR